MDLKVSHFTFGGGERYKLLLDAKSGVPVYYPSLFITTHIRGSGQSISSVQSVITALKVLYAWLDYYQLDIEARFGQSQLLSVNEIITLRDFCKNPLREDGALSSVVRLPTNGRGTKVVSGTPAVSSETQYSRMTHVADYLKFLAETLGSESQNGGLAKEIDSMWSRIKVHRPKRKGRKSRDRDEKGLDPELVDKVLECLQLSHPENPFLDAGVQLRNGLIVALLRHLGVRRGELLNLRVEDIDFTSNELRIVRRADSVLDHRTYQPLVKTLERTLPISAILAKKLSEYVINNRRLFPRAKQHPYLFVTHKAGPWQGEPLSNSGFGKLMKTIQGIADDMGGVHAHAFRHSWNYFYSCLVDESESNISPEREEQMRSYLMGWSPTSGTAATYNARHIKEKAKAASLGFQEKLHGKR